MSVWLLTLAASSSCRRDCPPALPSCLLVRDGRLFEDVSLLLRGFWGVSVVLRWEKVGFGVGRQLDVRLL
jgi:hypothetical protein